MDKEQLKAQPTGKRAERVPVWKKPLLTVTEAAEHTGIGKHKLYEMTEDNDCDFVLWNGSKRMIKRERFEAYLMKSFSI